MNIIKRDGTEQTFNSDKIRAAILKANESVSNSDKLELFRVDRIVESVVNSCKELDHTPLVEEIQDMVEERLMTTGNFNLARSYITYRYLNNLARNQYKELMGKVKDKLTASHVENQNANVDEHSFGGRIGESADIVMREYALNYLLSEKARNSHLNNEIYIHDLNAFAVGEHNCLSIPFDDLLANGFTTRQTDVRPAQCVNTAFQLAAVIFQLQSLQQFGGVAATHIDWTMVPYVRKSFFKHFRDGFKYLAEGKEFPEEYNDSLSVEDALYKKYEKVYEFAKDMTEKELCQAVEGLYHNLNTLQSRSGNQLPFTSINYGTCTLPEGRAVIRNLLQVSIEGIGKQHRTAIFPCGIFQCAKGVNRKEGDPNYDLYRLALESTSKRLYPNYANIDWTGNEGYDKADPRTYFSTMGCRTANGFDINGFKQLKDGRGNICPVTIILPTIAMEAEKDVDKFLELLDSKICDAKDMLIERFNWICSQSPKSASFMYDNNLMAGYVPEEGIRSALKHGTLAIGQLGLAETLQILVGCDHTEHSGMQLAKRIEELFKKRCAEFKETYKLNFGVYFTPAENLCYTAMKKFKEKYGVIKNVSDREYFTNSMHVPVWHKMTAFDKIDIESQLTSYSSAGCITYVELDAACQHNIDALDAVVSYAMDKNIPYFAVNVPNDQCMRCGLIAEMNACCPACGSNNIKRLRRVTGYLTGDYKTAFNLGKQQETEQRVKHNGKL